MFERVVDETLDRFAFHLFGRPRRKLLIPQLLVRRRDRGSLAFLFVVVVVSRNETPFLVLERRRHCLKHGTKLWEWADQSIETRNLVVIVRWFVDDHVSEVLRYRPYPEYVWGGGGAVD